MQEKGTCNIHTENLSLYPLRSSSCVASDTSWNYIFWLDTIIGHFKWKSVEEVSLKKRNRSDLGVPADGAPFNQCSTQKLNEV